MKRAIVLLSGGLDSATAFFYAKKKGFKAHGLIFDYGQRHKKEILCAKEIARYAKCGFKVVKIRLPHKGSSLIDSRIRIPVKRSAKKINTGSIPSTYVPARNIIFLSFAVSYAEALRAETVFIGANSIDYSGYPDCRPEFLDAFCKMIKEGMKSGVEGKPIKIVAPLLHKTKAQIISLGIKLGVPYKLTWSCYRGGKNPCGACDSCLFRKKGFNALKVKDPIYKK